MFAYKQGRKGRGKDRIAVCRICHRTRIKCKAKTAPNQSYCKNPPRLCGYCTLHCKLNEERRKAKR